MDKTIVIVAIVAVAGIAGVATWKQMGTSSTRNPQNSVAVKLPKLSDTAQAGQAVFERKCIACHGKNAVGTDVGPPLLHKIYEPSHHGDRSFHLAVANGVRAHHWPFGDMPRIGGVSQTDVSSVVAYVRELQRANGIN